MYSLQSRRFPQSVRKISRSIWMNSLYGKKNTMSNEIMHYSKYSSMKELPQMSIKAFSRNYNQERLIKRSISFDLSITPSQTNTPKEWHNPSFMKNQSVEAKETWLQSMLHGKYKNNLDTIAYNIVLDAWSHSNKPGSPQKTEYWISQMEEHHKKLVLSQMTLEDAKQIYQNIMNDSNFSTIVFWSQVQPNVESYNSVIRAWSKRKEDVAIVRAERWFTKMQNIASSLSSKTAYESLQTPMKTNSIFFWPNTESYKLFLQACSMGHGKKKEAHLANAKKAEKTLQILLQTYETKQNTHAIPNVEIFNHVLKSWVKCKREPSIGDKVMRLLRDMEAYQHEADDPNNVLVKPNTASYTIAIDAWGIVAAQKARQYNYMKKTKKLRDEKNNHMINGYNEVCNAEAILNYMHDLNDAGNNDVVPDTTAYNCLIKCWTNVSNETNKDAPFKAEQVVRRMIEYQLNRDPYVSPDYLSYGMIIQAWSKTNRGNSASRANWWLEKMKNQYNTERNENLKPNAFAYNAVMRAYSQLHDLETLDKLFKELTDVQTYEDENIGPNSDSYAIAISGWTRYESYCTVENAGKGYDKANQYLNEMIEKEEKGSLGIITTPELYNSVLRATRISKSTHIETLQVALDTFSKLQSSRHHVDWFSYKCLLEVGLRVMSKESFDNKRNQFLKSVVQKCCDDGLLASGVVKTIVNSPVYRDGWTIESCNEITKNIFGDWPIPQVWTRNLKDPKLIPTKEDLLRTNLNILGRGENKQWEYTTW